MSTLLSLNSRPRLKHKRPLRSSSGRWRSCVQPRRPSPWPRRGCWRRTAASLTLPGRKCSTMPHRGYRAVIIWLFFCLDHTGKINLSWLFQVMEAEQARTRSEAEHRKTASNYNSSISHMRQLEKKLKRSINKSRSEPLFPLWMFPLLFPLLGPRSVWVCLCVRKRGYVYVIWCSPDVSCVSCAALGCAPFVGAKECDCS